MNRRYRFKDERGVALFLCLFALLLLTSIGLGMMFMASTETSINYNYRSSAQAFYGARAGVAEGIDRLRSGSSGGYSITPPSTMPSTSATTGVTYILNPTGSETVAPWSATNAYFDNELCNEYFLSSTSTNLLGVAPVGNGIPCSTAVTGTYYSTVTSQSPNTGTAAALPYKWVRITLKQNKTLYPYCPNGNCTTNANSQLCWTGQHEVTLASLTGYTACGTSPAGSPQYTPVYVVTAMAKTKTGSKRMYQAEYAPNPPVQVSSAVASKAGVNLTGSLTVNGYDACTCSCTASGNSQHPTYTCTARYSGGTCDTSKAAIMSASNVDNPNSSETVVAGTGPIIENLGSSYPSGLDAQSLINQYSPGATVVTSCSTAGTCGTVPSPFPPTDPANAISSGQVSMINSDADLSGGGGSGVLIVNGNLTIHGGGFQWYGLILVKGTVTFQGGGSAGTNIVGAVIAGQQANANVDTTLGGSVVINMDTCAIANSFKGQPLHFISQRELLY